MSARERYSVNAPLGEPEMPVWILDGCTVIASTDQTHLAAARELVLLANAAQALRDAGNAFQGRAEVLRSDANDCAVRLDRIIALMEKLPRTLSGAIRVADEGQPTSIIRPVYPVEED